MQGSLPAQSAAQTRAAVTVSLWAFQDGRVYKAVCPELSLLVRRNSLREAMDDLQALVDDYAGSFRAGVDSQSFLRPVPRTERIRLYTLKLLPLILWRTAGTLLGRDAPPKMELLLRSV